MFNLPASTSGWMKLDNIDYQKILRLATIVFLGAFTANVSAALAVPDLAAVNIQSVLQGGLQAGLAALGASALELFRRLVTDHTKPV